MCAPFGWPSSRPRRGEDDDLARVGRGPLRKRPFYGQGTHSVLPGGHTQGVGVTHKSIGRRPTGPSMEAVSVVAAPPRTATKDEIVDMHAKIKDLRIEIARRAHGGADVQGQYDTAWKAIIETLALPDLRLGKLPTADDERVLFPPADDDVDGEKRREIDAWVDKHKRDQRSSLTASYGLDSERQQQLMQWVARTTDSYVLPAGAPAGAPRVYRRGLRKRSARRDMLVYCNGIVIQYAVIEVEVTVHRANISVYAAPCGGEVGSYESRRDASVRCGSAGGCWAITRSARL